jgi:hypothetical protein
MSLLRRFTNFILSGRAQAFGVAFVCAYVPLLGSISILIAGLVTLRKGAVEGALILCAATIPFLLSYYMTSTPVDQTDIARMAIGTVVASNILVWLYAILLRQYGNWSLLLELSILVSVVLVGVIHFFNPDIQNWWSTQLTAYFTKAKSLMNGSSGADINMQLQAVGFVKPYATGLAVVSILYNGLLQLVISRWWEVALFIPGTLRQELYRIRFGYVVAALFIVVLLLSFWNNATALDLKPIFYGLFFIAGLSLIHCLLASRKYSWLWLTLIYIALVVFFPRSMMIIAVFCVIRCVIKFT